MQDLTPVPMDITLFPCLEKESLQMQLNERSLEEFIPD